MKRKNIWKPPKVKTKGVTVPRLTEAEKIEIRKSIVMILIQIKAENYEQAIRKSQNA